MLALFPVSTPQLFFTHVGKITFANMRKKVSLVPRLHSPALYRTVYTVRYKAGEWSLGTRLEKGCIRSGDLE